MTTTKLKFKHKEYTIDKVVNNLLRYYDLSTYEEVTKGLSWYTDAHNFCLDLAERFEVSLEQAAGVIAALSPQVGWDQNKRYAITALTEPRRRVIATRERTGKARKIQGLNGLESIHRALSVNDNGANKTKAFFMNIVKPWESTTCTIDRHAVGCAIQHPSRVKALTNGQVDMSTPQYEFFVECYRKAAEWKGILPHQFQAILWMVYRRLRELREHKEVSVWQPIDMELEEESVKKRKSYYDRERELW